MVELNKLRELQEESIRIDNCIKLGEWLEERKLRIKEDKMLKLLGLSKEDVEKI